MRHVRALRVEPGGRLGERGHVVGVQHDRSLRPSAGPAADGWVGEQERGELVQAAAPRQPLVRRAGRLVVDVLDPGLLERLVIVLDALVHPPLGRADAQPEDAHPPVERVRVRHDAAVGRLRVEGGAAEAAAAPAEAAEVGEQVEMLERDLERLHAAHREPGHRPALAVRDRPIGRVDHRDQVLDHHLLERAEHPAEVGARGGILAGRGRRAGAGGRGAGAGSPGRRA